MKYLTGTMAVVLMFLFQCCGDGGEVREGAGDTAVEAVDTTRPGGTDVAGDVSAVLDTVALTKESLSMDTKAYDMMQELRKVLDTLTIDRVRYYVVEGDQLMDRDDLFRYCRQRLQNKNTDNGVREKSQLMTLALLSDGKYNIWPSGYKITYSVLEKSFRKHKDYEEAVVNMQKAAADWMSACNVSFEYLPQHDNDEVDNDPLPNLTFVVREYNAKGKFIAYSFFPNDPPYARRLLIDPSYYTAPVSKVGILRHELGHVLGFRHEHIWSTTNNCNGERVVEGFLGAKPLTPYNCFSVMHYLCNNCGTSTMELTDFDKSGAASVYGPPRR